jgi:hypothetical protein
MSATIPHEPKGAPRSAAGRLARDAGWFLAAGLGIGVLLAGYYVCLVEGVLPLPSAGAAVPAGALPDVHMRLRGIRLPPVRAAADAGLDDSAEVIGICAGGRARAYLVGVMGAVPTRHVVNDLVGGRAVSVTYCDRNGCARAFSGGPADAPLDIGVGGFLNGGLVLRSEGEDYSQETGACLSSESGPALPYAVLPHMHTTWKAWRQAHPDTDVYMGDPPAGQVMPPGMLPEAAS